MSLAMWGALGGAGRGLNDVGRQMELDALEERRQKNLADIAAARDASREHIADNRLAGGGTRSGTRSGGGGGGPMSLADLRNDAEGLAFANASDVERIKDAQSLAKGIMPTRQIEGPPLEGDDGSAIPGPREPLTVDKYTPGEAQKVREEGRDAFWSAMKLNDPSHADDLSKSQRTDQGTKFAAEYRQGNDKAGEAALINDSKPAFDDGSSNATGKVTPGSLADARAKEREAKAKEDVARGAAAGKGGAGGGKVGGLTGDDATDQKIIAGRSATAGRDLVAADRALKDAREAGDKDGIAKAKQAQDAARVNMDEVKAAERDLVARRAARIPGATPAAAPAPKAEAPKARDTLPPGAKQIGTSGGRPVYQTPDGKKFKLD